MRSSYLRFCVKAYDKWPFYGTFPLMNRHSWFSFANLLSDYILDRRVSCITRAICINIELLPFLLTLMHMILKKAWRRRITFFTIFVGTFFLPSFGFSKKIFIAEVYRWWGQTVCELDLNTKNGFTNLYFFSE